MAEMDRRVRLRGSESLTISVSISLSLFVSLCLSLSLFVSVSIYLPIYFSTYLKGNNYVRLPSKVEVDRSKTKKFCETSSKNECSQLQNEKALRDFFKNVKDEAILPVFLQKF